MSAHNEQCMADLYDSGYSIGSKSMGDTNDDIFWKLLGSFLVFFMQAGFAMLEAGQVRVKNRNVTLMKNVMDATTGGIVWYLVGYAFADGTSAGGFIGASWDVLSGCADYSNWLWKWTFAATAATIVSGAVAERCRFFAYICLSVLMQGFVYPVVAHWVWNDNGWLRANTIGGNGVMDFAGAGVVHVTGGMAALVGAYIIGPRAGRFSFEGTLPFKQNDIALSCLGTFCLWFSWFAFNCVSTGSYKMMYLASRIAVVTGLGGCSGGLGSLIVGQCFHRHPDIMQVLNGILGGLVSITAGANVMEPGFAILTGMIGGAVVFALSAALKVVHIDDVVDAAPIHLGGGVWGMLATGLFASPSYVGGSKYYGIVYGGNPLQLAIQLVGIASIVAWSGALLGGAFFLLRSLNLLRVSFDEEIQGLDKLMAGGAETAADSQQAFPPSTPGSNNPPMSYDGSTPRATDSSCGAVKPFAPKTMEMYLSYSQEHKQNRKPRSKFAEVLQSVRFEARQTDIDSIPEGHLVDRNRRLHATDRGKKAPAFDHQGRRTRSEDQASSSSAISIDIK